MTNRMTARLPLYAQSALLLLVLLLGLTAPIFSQIRPEISLVPRQRTYHPVGAKPTLSRAVTARIGGVMSQATVSPIDALEDAYLSLPLEQANYICIVTNGDVCVKYEIEYADLVPIVMWISSGGTSLYTAHALETVGTGEEASESDPGILDLNFLKDAGFAPTEIVQGAAAIEFVGTRFEEALYYLDFCDSCLAPPDADLAQIHNNELDTDPVWRSVLSGDRPIRDREASYINADIDSSFAVNISSGVLTIDGFPARYHWWGFEGSERRYLDAIRFFLSSEDTEARTGEGASELDHELAEIRRSLEAATAAVEALDKPSEAVLEILRSHEAELGFVAFIAEFSKPDFEPEQHSTGLFLYRTAALLRYFAQKDADAWNMFLAEVQGRARTFPEPWEQYGEVYEEIYGINPFPAIRP